MFFFLLGFALVFFIFLLLLLLLEIIVFSYLFFFFCCLVLKFISLFWAQAFSRTMPVESHFIGQKDKTWTANSLLFVAHGTTLCIENRTIFSNHTKLYCKDERKEKKNSEKLETFVNRMASNEPCLLWCTVVYQRCNIFFFPSSYVRFPIFLQSDFSCCSLSFSCN